MVFLTGTGAIKNIYIKKRSERGPGEMLAEEVLGMQRDGLHGGH
jgi:hypothetical protein